MSKRMDSQQKPFPEWTYHDVSTWLSENGLPDEICEAFEGKYSQTRVHVANFIPRVAQAL